RVVALLAGGRLGALGVVPDRGLGGGDGLLGGEAAGPAPLAQLLHRELGVGVADDPGDRAGRVAGGVLAGNRVPAGLDVGGAAVGFAGEAVGAVGEHRPVGAQRGI